MFVDEIVSNGVFTSADACHVITLVERSYAGVRDYCSSTSADANQHGGCIVRLAIFAIQFALSFCCYFRRNAYRVLRVLVLDQVFTSNKLSEARDPRQERVPSAIAPPPMKWTSSGRLQGYCCEAQDST